MPGMGGPDASRNFILNCAAWKKIPYGPFNDNSPLLTLAPMTGGEENVGYSSERQFYFDMMKHCAEAGIKITLGDGTPDTKLQWGIEAVREQKKNFPDLKATVFSKPYADSKILERLESAQDIMEAGGLDIDSYNIITMRSLVHLEKKQEENLLFLKKELAGKSVPFAVKGIFNSEDVELIKKVKPDIAVISNHGGRVDVRKGSTAEFLAEYYRELESSVGELWVDGGIRSQEDFAKAASYGVKRIMLGRPFVTALCYGKKFTDILI